MTPVVATMIILVRLERKTSTFYGFWLFILMKSLAIMCNSFCMTFTCAKHQIVAELEENNLKSAPKSLYNDGM